MGELPLRDPARVGCEPRDTIDRSAADPALSGMGSVVDVFPLAPGQLDMLIQSERLPRTGVYVEQRQCVVCGDLDLDTLAMAWRRLTEAREIMRLSIYWQGLSQPVQVVHREPRVDLRLLDSVPPGGRSALVESDAIEGFILERAPLTRLTTVREDNDRTFMLWTFHHALLDGWSWAILLHELFALYLAIEGGTELRLPVRTPFKEYVRWRLASDTGPALRYWEGRLAGYGEPVGLPPCEIASGSPEERLNPGARFARIHHSTSDTLTERTERCATEHHVSPAAVYFAAWQIVVSSWAGRSDVVTGLLVSGRSSGYTNAEDTVGLLLNTLPVRTLVSPQMTIGALVGEVMQEIVAANDHDGAHLLAIHRALRRPTSWPLFHALFVVQNFPFAGVSPEDDSFIIDEVDFRETTELPIFFMVVPAGRIGTNGLICVSWDTELLRAEQVEVIIAQYEGVMWQILDDPGRLVGDIVIADFDSIAQPGEAESDEGTASKTRSSYTGSWPVTVTDEEIRAVWERVLHRPVCDPEGDFYALGGDSLAALMVVGALRETVAPGLPVAIMWTHATPATLAQAIKAHLAETEMVGESSNAAYA
jgi:hypothetical protein